MAIGAQDSEHQIQSLFILCLYSGKYQTWYLTPVRVYITFVRHYNEAKMYNPESFGELEVP